MRQRTLPDPAASWWLAKAEARNHVFEVKLRADGKEFGKVELTTPRTKPVE